MAITPARKPRAEIGATGPCELISSYCHNFLFLSMLIRGPDQDAG
ncbi:hypothetical protein A3768_4049 (plasmid) [Ralstonia solanacearum]|nr:hypothetical protein F504_3738 [Ralstonia pseudosolanacearum FQY_4]ANH34878.1 hypothetical protein A3768_4049 [Ralstonia solanacearum]